MPWPRGTRAPHGHLERQGRDSWGLGRWEEGEDKGGHGGGAGEAEGRRPTLPAATTLHPSDITSSPPRRPARRQARTPDPPSQQGAAAEAGPALAGAGTIP
jgi:hypothetical protein